MQRFTLWMVLVFGAAAAAALLPHAMPHSPDRLNALSPAAGTPYDIAPAQAVRHVDPPDLPDISGETVAAVRAAMPAALPGGVRVRNAEDVAYIIRRDVPLFAERQRRFNPRVIVIDSGVHDLPSLYDAVKDASLLSHGTDGSYRLHVPLLIGKDAGLIIGDETRLLLGQGEGALIANFGRLDIVGAQVAGWDFARNAPAAFKDHDDFRPYIVSLCGSTMNLAGSRFAHLGYLNAKAYGITYTSCDSDSRSGNDSVGATGRIIDNHFDDIYYGFYSYESNDIKIIGNHYIDNVIYGIDPHDRSKNLIIARNVVRGTKQKHGIILSRAVDDSFVFDNISEDNAGSGLILDRASRNNIVARNVLRRNGGDGMAFYESGNNFSFNNTMTDNGGVGMRIRNSAGIVSREDVMSGNRKGGAEAYAADLAVADAVRNLSADPYEQVASADIAHAEMIGNGKADFTLRNVDDIRIGPVRRYQSPKDFIAGDVQIKDAQDIVIRRVD